MGYQNDFYSDRHDLTLSSAKETLKAFVSIYKPKSAVDVGCGVGTWLEVLKKGGCRDILGIDSTDVPEKYLRLNKNEFLIKNLEHPFKVNKRYDLAISLEVAEHLSPKAGRMLVKNLCRLSDLVLFSAAIPAQGGVNHINEQWQSYWQKLFLEENYICLDILRPKIWNNKNIFYWYRQNSLIYIKKNAINRVLGKTYKGGKSLTVDIVHPESYLLKSKESRLDLIISKLVQVFSVIRK